MLIIESNPKLAFIQCFFSSIFDYARSSKGADALSCYSGMP